MKKSILFWIGLLSLISTILIITNSCEKDETPLPELTTKPIYYHTQNSANSGGTIINDEQVEIISCGVCWSTSTDPTIEDHKSISVLKDGTYTSSITGLESETKYYVRAYATNDAGTAYGNNNSFTTLSPVSDIDGNSYNTVRIDNQTWFNENLKTTHYANGDVINDGTDAGDIREETEPKYWFAYDNNLSNVNTYGRLYTWYAATDSRNVCPDGWHVGTGSEWTSLFEYLGGRDIAGGKLKETGTVHWFSPNTGATNETSFNALPGGSRYMDGNFVALGYTAKWWTSQSTDDFSARQYSARYDVSNIYYFNNYMTNGNSLRCVED